MAHEIDKSNERENMAYVGEAPWHRLGNQLTAGADIDTWKTEAGLGWSVIPSPVHFADLEGQMKEWAERIVLVRSDTGVPLSVVSNLYHPVQPPQVLEFFRDLIEVYSAFSLETAGSLRGGQRIWAMAKATDEFCELQGKDQIARYLLLATSFDKSMSTIVQQTAVRVVCNNTLSLSYGRGERGQETQLKISHGSEFRPEEVKDEMFLNEEWAQFTSVIHQLSKRHTTVEETDEFFRSVYYPAVPLTELSKGQVNRIVKLEEVCVAAPGQQLASAKGTAWGLLNTVTFEVDHGGKSRAEDKQMDSSLFGYGKTVKERAWNAATALIEN